MNLIVETFHNNAIFEEIFALMKSLGVSAFDCLLYLKEHQELYPETINHIIDSFLEETTKDLFDSIEQTKGYVLTPDIIGRYIGGELGTNELLIHQAQLFSEFEDTCELIFKAAKGTLLENNLLTAKVENYLDELQIFTTLRKIEPFADTDTSKNGIFQYDFETIAESNYQIDPNYFPVSDSPIAFRFFHDKRQRAHIANQLRIYASSPTGLGRLIQRSNLKLVFRKFVKSESRAVLIEN